MRPSDEGKWSVCPCNTPDNVFPNWDVHTEELGKGEETEKERKRLIFGWQKEEQNMEVAEFPQRPQKVFTFGSHPGHSFFMRVCGRVCIAETCLFLTGCILQMVSFS